MLVRGQLSLGAGSGKKMSRLEAKTMSRLEASGMSRLEALFSSSFVVSIVRC